MEWLIIVLGVSLWMLVYYLLRPLFQRKSYVERLAVYTGQADASKEEKQKKIETYHHGLGLIAKGIERTGAFTQYKNNIRKKLNNASILMRPEEFLSVCLILFGVFGFLGFVLFGRSLLVLLPAFLGWFLPSFILKRHIGKRLKTINNQLGDTIAILSNSMKAGHSFFQAVDSVSHEMTGPVADEFAKLQKEISLGVNTETALENMVSRVGSDDLELMVTAVLIQRQIGGNLSEILDNISGTIRQRIRSKGEIKTLTAQGRMSGIIISLLPFGLAAVVAVVSPQQIITLVTDPLGIVLIVIALLMECIGILFVRKIINVEV